MTVVANPLGELLRRRVLIITGSGVSAESGIPTFRGAGGHWRNRDPMRLATPEAFAEDPALVWEWYTERRQTIRAAQPNAAHEALVRIVRDASDALIVTQNVDDLHERAGTPADRLVHVHGEIAITRCSRCAFQTRDEFPAAPVPACPRCGVLMRPGVVWFGESLDRREVARVERFFDAGGVDLVLAIGTTALFGYIIDWVTRGANLVEINPEPTSISGHARWTYRLPATQALAALS